MALCLFIETECESLNVEGHSGSGVAPEGPSGLSEQVKMDEMATVMNVR